MTLVKARRVTIGGNSSGVGSLAVGGQGNRIVTNRGYGLSARGACNGSVVQGNTIVANAVKSPEPNRRNSGSCVVSRLVIAC